MDRVLLVAFGGGIGSVLRYATSVLAVRWMGPDFPYGTLIVNIVGSFLIGVVQELAGTSGVIRESVRLFLSAGVMGGFTTYSAFSYETVRLVQLDSPGRALVNVAVTTLVCLAVCMLGIFAARAAVSLRG